MKADSYDVGDGVYDDTIVLELARKWKHRAENLRAAVDTVLDSRSANAVIDWSRQTHGPWDGPWTDDDPDEEALLAEAEQ